MPAKKSRKHRELDDKKDIAGSNLKDVILGGQDGLVNVLGIVLGLAGANIDTKIIIIAGLVATAAESISMAAVAYTSNQAAKSFYDAELAREYREVEEMPGEEKQEVKDIFIDMGFQGTLLNRAVNTIIADKDKWVEFMMSHEIRLFPDEYKNPLKNAIVVGTSAVVGSLIPLVGFVLTKEPIKGAIFSLLIAAAALFLLGAIKAKITVGNWFKSGFQLMAIGIISALVGFVIGYLLGTNSYLIG